MDLSFRNFTNGNLKPKMSCNIIRATNLRFAALIICYLMNMEKKGKKLFFVCMECVKIGVVYMNE